MQSRYVLALCVVALLVAVVSAQQAAQQNSIVEKLKEEGEKIREAAERLIHGAIAGMNAARHCIKEAGEHCKDQLKIPLNDYVKCAIDYVKANKEKCKQESKNQ